jgi:hypothetical protein
VYVAIEEAKAKGWKSKSAWQREGYRVKNQSPIATVYRKTAKSRGLSFRNQDFIAKEGDDIYLVPAEDEVVDGRFICNSWDVYSPEQVVSKKPQPRRRPQVEVGLYRPEGHQLPLSITEQEQPFAHWLLSHLYYHPLMKFRHDRWEQYVPCGSKFLEAMMGRGYKSIVRKLVEAGEIEPDGVYWPGDQQIMGKCLGYRLGEHLRPAQTKWRWLPVPCNTLHKRIVRWKNRSEQKLSPRQQLMLADLKELTIDGNSARAIVPAIVQSRIPDWEKAIKSGRIKKSLDDLKSEFAQQLSRQIEAIERGDWYLKPDRYGREHSNITNLTSELRQFLSFHGESLENVDTSNSQPLFLGLSLKNAIKKEELPSSTTVPYCSAYCAEERKEEEEDLPTATMPYCSANCAEDDPAINEVDKYLDWCEEGIYDKLATKTRQPRDKVKKEMFAGVLFNRETGWQNNTAKAFEEEFPNIRQELADMKAHGYKKVAHAMQRTEAAFMFGKVIPRLLQENPQMPMFTLHDSVLTTPHYSQYVQGVMKDEFEKLDIKAKVRIEPCVQTVAA